MWQLSSERPAHNSWFASLSKIRECPGQDSGLELKISTMSDYETTKKDLSILRSLEFGIDDEQEQRPLEVMILERSKTLQVILDLYQR